MIIIDLTNVSVEQVCRALNLGLADASLLARRSGYQSLRIASLQEAEASVAHLRRNGVAAWYLPEEQIEACRRPLILRGGDVAIGHFVLAENAAPILISDKDLLLVIWGRIHRERHETPGPDRLRPRPSLSLLALDDEHRIHLHRRLDPRPLEIDPGAFEFTDLSPSLESSLIRIRSGLESLYGQRIFDDAFRFETPALAPMQKQPLGVFTAVDSLKAGLSARRDRASDLLNNLDQFRFYSAWRGALARALAHD